MLKIEIYSKNTCPYCQRAKLLLESKGINNYLEINIEKNPEKLEEMLKRSQNRRTVPQIFINDQHIGGFDDLNALDQAGKLNGMLNL